MPSIVVIGTGYWGKNLARATFNAGCLAGIVDADPARAAEIAAQYGAPVFADMAAAKDAGGAAAIIATPAETHVSLVSEALSLGLEVFVEKPLALTVADAETLRAQADAAGRILMVGHLLQYHPAFATLRGLVADGALGEVKRVYSNRLSTGKLRLEEDAIWSFSPHDISMILALVGAEVASVSATGQAIVSDGLADAATIQIGFDNGAQAQVMASWWHPAKEHKLTVIGTQGMAVFDDTKGWDEKLVIYRHKADYSGPQPNVIKGKPEPVALTEAEPLLAEVRHFAACCESRNAPRTDGAEGVRVLKVLEAASASLKQGTAA